MQHRMVFPACLAIAGLMATALPALGAGENFSGFATGQLYGQAGVLDFDGGWSPASTTQWGMAYYRSTSAMIVDVGGSHGKVLELQNVTGPTNPMPSIATPDLGLGNGAGNDSSKTFNYSFWFRSSDDARPTFEDGHGYSLNTTIRSQIIPGAGVARSGDLIFRDSSARNGAGVNTYMVSGLGYDTDWARIETDTFLATYGTWYRASMTYHVKPGFRDDTVDYVIKNEAGTTVWSRLGEAGWEGAYYDLDGNPNWMPELGFGLPELTGIAFNINYGLTGYDSYAGGIYVDDMQWSVPATLVVDPSGTACDGSGTAYTTINAAIAAASPGDIIKVCPGTYPEMVNINKSITLLGANAGIHPAVGTHPTETVGARGPESILSHNGLYAIHPAADNITIDGFKFTGSGGRLIDTYADANNFHLTNCIFDDPAAGSGQGVIQFAGGNHADMLIDFNLFQDKGDNTIYAGGSFDRLRIAYNRFNVTGCSVFWTASPLVGGVIEGNEFDGTIGGVQGVGSGAMNIGQGGNIAIRDNWFHDQQYMGFQVGICGGSVTGNTFERIYPPAGGFFADAFQLWGGQWGTAVSANVDISCNTIQYNDIPGAAYPTRGIRLRPADSGGAGIDGTTIHVHNNSFVNGGIRTDAYAVVNQGDSTKALDATGNWWGTTNSSEIAALMSGNVNYASWLSAAPICTLPDNVVYLDVTTASVYVKPVSVDPTERVVVDMDVANLLQPVAGLQAMLHFSSTYFSAAPADVGFAPGGGVWNDAFGYVYGDSHYQGAGATGDLDTMALVDTSSGAGTSANGKAAYLTLKPIAEGVAQIVFRVDGALDNKQTMFTMLGGGAIYPAKIDSTNIYIDGTAPTVAVSAAKQGDTDVLTCANQVVEGTVNIAVTASDAIAGLAASPEVTFTKGTDSLPVTFVNESPAGTFNYTVTFLTSTPAGTWSIAATATDRAGNAASASGSLCFDRKITGTVELQSLDPPTGGLTRTVTFVATGGASKTWNIPVTFAAGSTTGSFTLTDVPTGTTGLSAKTAWNLRRKTAITLSNGQASAVSFTGESNLLGGDLNGSNTINVLDYGVLKGAWGGHTAGDVNGDGFTATLDYSIMKTNWFKTGDPE